MSYDIKPYNFSRDLTVASPLRSIHPIPISFSKRDRYLSVLLGREVTTEAPVFWNIEKLVNQHMVVMGVPGSGKSFFMKQLVKRILTAFETPTGVRARMVIVDPEGEYPPVIDSLPGIRSIHLHVGENVHPNPLALPLDREGRVAIDPVKWAAEISSFLVNVVFSFRAPRQVTLLREVIVSLYKEANIRYASKPRSFPSMLAVETKLKAKMSDNEEKGAKEVAASLYEKVHQLNVTGGFGDDDELARIFEYDDPVVIDVSGMSEEASSVVRYYILMLFKNLMYMQEMGKGVNAFLILDEAWKILQMKDTPLQHILREGRKYGFSLIFITQRIEDVAKNEHLGNIASMFATTVVFNVNDAEAAAGLAKRFGYFNDKEIAVKMANLPRGTALLHFLPVSKRDKTLTPVFIHTVRFDPARVIHLKVMPRTRRTAEEYARIIETRERT